MRIGVVRERRPGEARIATSPDAARRFAKLGVELVVERGAGEGARFSDAELAEAGATIVEGPEAALGEADVVLKVRRPLLAGEDGIDELALMRRGAVLVGLLNPLVQTHQVEAYARHGITAFALELVPRISRAQSMDALSSQSNLAGYKAVIEAASALRKLFPMLMTAAGTIAPARVLVLGAGVAGLQAIATARRLGAVVSAFDVRPAVKEEVESLGAAFVEVPMEAGAMYQTAGGYAMEVSEDYQRRQRAAIHEAIRRADIAIATALVPGKRAPILITEAMLRDMKPGSVIVDMAVDSGGNCELSEAGRVVEKLGVTLIGHQNLPALVATDASALYARNLLSFVAPMIDKASGALAIDWNDEIVKACCLTREGAPAETAAR